MKQTLLLFVISILFSLAGLSQSINGIGYWGFGGITNVAFNPAIAGGRYLFDVNVGSFAQQHETDALSFQQFDKYFPSVYHYYDYRNRFTGNGLEVIPVLGSFSENQRLLLPGSFLMTTGNRRKNVSALAFSYELRNHSNFRNLPVDLLLGFLRYPDVTQYSAVTSDVAINVMSWKSFNLSYSYLILDKGEHTLSAGLTLKLMQGIRALHFYATDFNIDKTADSLTSVSWTGANFFQTQDIGQSNGVNTGFTGKQPAGVGGDIGFVYEFRPNVSELDYNMNDTSFRDHTRLPYLFAVGASLTDFGSLKYKNTGVGKMGDFKRTFEDFTIFDNSGKLNDTLRLHAAPVNVADFTVKIPAMLNLFADVNIYKGAGLNIAYSLPVVSGSRNEPFVQANALLTITPKFERKDFGAYVPFSLPEQGNFRCGLSLRAGPVFFGTNDIASMITGVADDRSSGSWYFGIRIPIINRKHKDTDFDYYSDEVDACIDLAGVKSAKGCPDRDGDSIEDKIDLCPDIPGLITFNGCPDMDGDGITDADDFCPDVAGPQEGSPKRGCPDDDQDGFIDSNGEDKCPGISGARDGCPDKDGDGVYDHEDKCPDVPGFFTSRTKEKAFVSGCPDDDDDGLATFEDACPDLKGPEDNAGCPYGDYDNDGVYDFEDSCETVYGEKSLKGCPPKKIININVLLDILYFTIDDSLTTTEISKIMKILPILKEHASSENTSAIILEGHADVNEPAESRKAVSVARGQKVKEFLMAEGIPEQKMIVRGKGDQEPTTKKSFPTGKNINRRVEILLDSPQTE